jgi:hypothetical protein
MQSIKIKVEIVIEVELADGFNILPADIVQECDYYFNSQTSGATVINSEIRDFTVIDAK